MTSAKEIAYSPYGAFELKRSYQKNMLTGTLISGSIPLLIIAVFLLVAYVQNFGEIPALPVNISVLRKVAPPPPISIDVQEPTAIKQIDPIIPSFGEIRPVEDNPGISTTVVPTRIEVKEDLYSKISKGDVKGVIGGVYRIEDIENTLIPPADSFVSRTKDPVLIHAPVPVYPGMARTAGIEGRVFMQVYVDTEGVVRDVRVTKSSGTNAGFDEAAEAAAWGRVYSPAMQNKQPVGVWIGYVVKFQLSY